MLCPCVAYDRASGRCAERRGFCAPTDVCSTFTCSGCAYYAVHQAIHNDFGPGTRLYKATASSPAVEALASATKTLLVNELPMSLTVDLNGTTLVLRGYDMYLL